MKLHEVLVHDFEKVKLHEVLGHETSLKEVKWSFREVYDLIICFVKWSFMKF